MKQVRNINLYGWGLGLLLVFAACSDEETNLAPQEGNATMTFRLSTRADEEELSDVGRETYLYIAERRSEHTSIDDDESLHYDRIETINGNTYSVNNLLGQWYKFAFISLPEKAKISGPANNHDFNELYINYSDVLEYQEDCYESYQDIADEDLAVYRKIIDRWAVANVSLTEDVELTRVTGQLVLDMGKVADQFDEKGKEIEYVQIYFKTPISFYFHDEARDSVIIMEHNLGTGSPREFIIKWVPTKEEFEKNERKIFTINLLPCVLDNKTTGKEAKITIKYKNQSLLGGSYIMQNSEGEPIQIKPNIRTIVRFNGLHTDEFEVRYAGFADGNDAVVGVDNDEWNGNQLNKGDN